MIWHEETIWLVRRLQIIGEGSLGEWSEATPLSNKEIQSLLCSDSINVVVPR